MTEGPVINFRSEEGKPFSDWPTVGEVLRDKRGARRLTITEVNPHLGVGGRHVAGTLEDGNAYACDLPTLLIQWGR